MGKYEGTRQAYVYGLVDPRSDLVRYVGKSLTPEQRLGRHIANAEGGAHLKKNRWIASLASQGLEPTMKVLAEGVWTSDELDDQERNWIAKATALVGTTLLTNCGPGGEGGWEHVNATIVDRKPAYVRMEEKRAQGLDWHGEPAPPGYYPDPFDCATCGTRVEWPRRNQTRQCRECTKQKIKLPRPTKYRK